MSILPRLKKNNRHSTPLVNLFAYIRDLFTTTRPTLRFDQQANFPYWPLQTFQPINRIPVLSENQDLICQWDNPDKPLLSLQRVENQNFPEIPSDLKNWIKIEEYPGKIPVVYPIRKRLAAFDESAHRLKAYHEFRNIAHGKSLDEVQDLVVPKLLDKWIAISENNGKIQVAKIEEAEETFHEDAHRKELLIAYSRLFQQFEEETYPLIQLNEVYDALHNLVYSLQAKPDKQICLSFGLVSGKIGGENYRNFLFHIPLKINLEKQIISLEADTLAHVITCEQAFTELIDRHFPNESEEKARERKLKVLRAVDQFNSQSREFNFATDYLRGTFYETAIRILEIFPEISDQFFQEDNLNFDLPRFQENGPINFSFSPVINLRQLATGVHIAHDADKIISKINELGTQGKNEAIPDFFKKLFSLRKPGNPLRIAYRVENKEAGLSDSISEKTPERFLFPLPYNQEQLSIAQQLLKQDAVTVQGPLGTGKSHTIANLASHFVAHGKSILIVSKNAKALEVIKGKLPPAIRNLAVAMLEGTKNQEELKHSIDAIKNHLNRHYDPEEVVRLEAELSDLEEKGKKIRKTVFEQIQTNQQSFSLYHPEQKKVLSGNAAFWATIWEKLNLEFELVSDEISLDENIEPYFEKVIELSEKSSKIRPEVSEIELPELSHFPSIEDSYELLNKISELKTTISINDYQSIDPKQLDEEFLGLVAEWKQTWLALSPYQKIIQHPRFNREDMATIWGEYQETKEKIELVNRELLGVKVDLRELTGEDPDFLLEELTALLGKFNDEGKLNLLKRKMLPKTQKALLETKVNSRVVRGPEELKMVLSSLKQASWNKQLTIVMDNYLSQLGISGEWEDTLVVYHEWEEVILGLAKVEQFQQQAIHRGLQKPENTEISWQYFDGLPSYLTLCELEEKWNELVGELKNVETFDHPIIQNLIESWRNRDLESVEIGFDELETLRAEQDLANEFQKLAAELSPILPKTIASILENQVPAFSREQLELEIFGKKLNGFLQEVLTDLGNPNNQLADLQIINQQIEGLVSQLVAEKTWASKQASITDEQRSSLTAWRNDLINIGKGYGKNTERNMKSAVANMQLAKDVVPIWIMQQKTAISFFPDPEPGQFDLLIVDEASQCDISMLNLIFRCKKVIVVGDENQTSVANQARFFPLGRTNQLLDRYLINHPFKQQFNINNRSTSIYTLSGVIYPNIISLREHFRCRPELIGFSNRYVYNSHIVPLRTATENHYGKATEVHYIEDDPQDIKKPAIVKAAIQLIEGLVEDVKAGHLPKIPSLGILCLESSNETHREYFIRELGKSKIIKANADELNLLVGTSREFQGDERDIMILTTTASHKFTDAGKIKPPRAVLGEEMMRIYNVAASRARDKAILLHSIHPEAVTRMNVECYRKRLIDYFEMEGAEIEETSPVSKMMHPKTGQVGKELFDWANTSAFATTLNPGFKVGPYQIDLAILNGGNKMAIFIDGETALEAEQIEKAIQQQLVLERAGWKCYRVQSLQWQIDKEKVMADLEKLAG